MIRFSVFVEEGDNCRVDPVIGPVLCTVLEFAVPNFSAGNCGPEVPNKLFGVIGRVDDSMILAEQFVPRVFRDFAEFVVDVVDYAALVRNGDDGRLIECKLDVGEFLEGTL